MAEQAGIALPPVTIYRGDLTHILTKEGIANLLLCRSEEKREQLIRSVTSYTAVGLGPRRAHGEKSARPQGILRAEDLGIDKGIATHNLFDARNMKDLLRVSDGLYGLLK